MVHDLVVPPKDLRWCFKCKRKLFKGLSGGVESIFFLFQKDHAVHSVGAEVGEVQERRNNEEALQ